MSSTEMEGQCSCNNEHSGKDRRKFLKNISLGGALLTGVPQIASAFQRQDDWSNISNNSKALSTDKAQKITLLHTADIHAQLYTHDEFFLENNKAVYKKRGGFAVLKTMLDDLRRKNPTNTLLIDGGDCFQGGGVAALSEGRAIIPLINHIDYDLVLPGNWEVVYGKEMMERDLGGYTAQKICANMFHDTNAANHGELIFHPWYVQHFGNTKIGFIGYNDPLTPKRQSPAYSKGIKFTKPEVNIQRYIKHLRDIEQCNLVFLVTHMGLAQQVDLGNMPYVEGIDFILGADTHERVRTPIQTKYTKVTEPGAFGSFVSKLELIVEGGKLKDAHYELLDVDPEKYHPDPEMLRKVEDARTPYAKEMDTVIGKTKTTLVRYFVLENPIDNLITDAIHWKYKPDIALSNGFRFCPPLVVDQKKGVAEITNEFLWNMLPVNSDAKAGEITGKQLWDWLEKELHNVFAKNPGHRFGGWVVRFAGMQINFTAYNEMGNRLNWVKIKGEEIELTKKYSIVACEREGDPDDTLCRIEKVSSAHKLGDTLHNIMREYLKEHPLVAPKVEGRVTATDVPEDLLSQLEGYDYQFR
jgi:2',3'-cyclic-nucleotide 2'-phosphodiesterase (5'-nucleotidase family)